MLYREIIAVCSEIHKKHINTLCGQNVEFVNLEPGGTYSDHLAWSERQVSMSVLPTLRFPVQSHNSAVCVRTEAQWKVRNEGCKTTKKQVGSGTETEM
jgi:hypothetical protein